MKDFFQQYHCQLNDRYSLIIEEDEKVCYAYLLKDEILCSDLWLYNNLDLISENEWKDKEKLPFGMPNIFLNEKYYILSPFQPDNFVVEWKQEKELIECEIIYNSLVIGKLNNQKQIGTNVLVNMNTPLANMFDLI